MKKPVLNLKGEEVGTVELADAIFGVKPQPTLLHEVTTIYEANQRLGTAHTKTRADVSGGGAKPWRQKGTGRARHGSIRSPIWTGGGVAFGPRKHSYNQGLPKRKAKKALQHALSARAQDGGLCVVESLKLEGAKTKEIAGVLAALKADKASLIVAETADEKLTRASRNIPGLTVRVASHLNAYEVIKARSVIITKGALEKLAPKFN